MGYSQFSRVFENNQQIFAQTWEVAESKGVVVLVHGLGEHSSRYQHVAEIFNRHNYSVIGFDLPGHGRSSGKRGHISSYDYAMKVIQYFLDYAHETYSGLPVFLYGHSMGGSLVLYYGLTQKPQITGIICSAPGLSTATPTSPLTLLLGKILYRVAPSVTMPNGLDVTGLSRDKSVVEKYIHDPLVTPLVSAALGIELIEKGKWMLDQKRAFPVPLLLLQGTSDRVVDPVKVKQFSSLVEGNVIFKEWINFYHELHNEPEQEEVIRFILQWMNDTLK